MGKGGALSGFIAPHLDVHFVSNVDSHHLEWTLRGLKPAETLFVIASKTFTTQETMSNAQLARSWFLSNGGIDTRKHFVACTTNVAHAGSSTFTTNVVPSSFTGCTWAATAAPTASSHRPNTPPMAAADGVGVPVSGRSERTT